MPQICVEFWGPQACFSLPGLKTERYSSDVPTPSAMRGCLSAVYNKSAEFWWQVRKIEIMRPIERLYVKLNEVTCRMGKRAFRVDDFRTQRSSVYLKNVRYRVTAEIIHRPGHSPDQLLKQAVRRFSHGQCFTQPYLGTRECTCYFAMADMSENPIPVDADFGFMLYDTHDPRAFDPDDSPFIQSLYHCRMDHGVIIVPSYVSSDVLKAPGREAAIC